MWARVTATAKDELTISGETIVEQDYPQLHNVRHRTPLSGP
jgi:hypothetical protein